MLKKAGIPEDHIITMAYDDIAHDFKNLHHRGKVFNAPTKKGVPGVDVYAGVKIDYKGKEVTKANLLKVLKGDSTAKGPVLKTNENSKVFFNFADHGGPGNLEMPNGEYFHADELNEAVEYMHTNKLYKEMVLYVEACESGSIFKNILKTDINAYALTAANSKESSWGTYCHPDDLIEGKSIGTCLGDLFSVNWMQDSD